MQYKDTTEIKERILIAIAPSCLNIFLFSRWLSICSFSMLGLAFQCESLGAWHINPEHSGWCPSLPVSSKCLLQELMDFYAPLSTVNDRTMRNHSEDHGPDEPWGRS